MRSVFFLFVYLMFLFQACDYVKIIHEKPKYISADQWVEEFDEVIVEIPVELELLQSAEQIARITGPDYKVDNLLLSVKDRILTIEASSFMYERKDQVLRIVLPVKDLSRVELNMPTMLSSNEELNLYNFTLVVNGPGTYSESNLHLNCKSIYIGAYGKNSGDHILEGKADELSLRLEGLAWVDAKLLEASHVKLTQRSLKSSYVHATDHLEILMYSEGNVYYKGDPTLDFKIVQPDWNPDFGQAIWLQD
jgi:hypothetical protein